MPTLRPSGGRSQPSRVRTGYSDRVLLTASALTVLRPLKETATPKDDYVLAGARGKRHQTETVTRLTIPDFRGHDLRRSVASATMSAGVPRLVIGKVLNHAERTVTAAYGRYSYDAEKRQVLVMWGRRLDAILQNRPSRAAVVPLMRSR